MPNYLEVYFLFLCFCIDWCILLYLGFRVYGLGFRVQHLGFGVWSFGFGILGLGFVWCLLLFLCFCFLLFCILWFLVVCRNAIWNSKSKSNANYWNFHVAGFYSPGKKVPSNSAKTHKTRVQSICTWMHVICRM